MRICYLARSNYTLFQRRAQSVARRGHEVHVISLQNADILNCTVHFLPTNKLLQRIKGHYLSSIHTVHQLLKEIKPDIIDIHGASSYGLLALLPLNSPLVVTLYGTDVYEHAKRFWILRKIAKMALHRSDMVYSSTPSIGSYVRTILGSDISDRLQVWPWGISNTDILCNAEQRRAEVRKDLGINMTTRVILHSRALSTIWRIPLIIESAPAIIAEYENTEFWFAFPPPTHAGQKLLDKLQQRVAELGIEKKVRWLGYHPYEKIISIMHAADIYVCIGEDDLLASSVLEALATGLVPILSNLDAYHEVVQSGSNGYLLSEINPDKLAQLVIHVLKNWDVIQPLVAKKNQSLMANDYDEEISTTRLLNSYQQIIQAFHNRKSIGNE